jgi:hypothetical protein
MVQRCKFSIELKNFPPDLSGEPKTFFSLFHLPLLNYISIEYK